MLEFLKTMIGDNVRIRLAGLRGVFFLMLALLFVPGCSGEPNVTPTPTLRATPTQLPIHTPGITQATVTPKADVTSVPEANIIVQSPRSGEDVRSPVSVRGKARVFEAVLEIVVRDAQGNEVGRVVAMASEGAPAWGDFDVKVPFTSPSGNRQGVVEVFSRSPRDGSTINLVRVPINLVSR